MIYYFQFGGRNFWYSTPKSYNVCRLPQSGRTYDGSNGVFIGKEGDYVIWDEDNHNRLVK
jgi:hypothetical protein